MIHDDDEVIPSDQSGACTGLPSPQQRLWNVRGVKSPWLISTMWADKIEPETHHPRGSLGNSKGQEADYKRGRCVPLPAFNRLL